jgi:hypothetical protein
MISTYSPQPSGDDNPDERYASKEAPDDRNDDRTTKVLRLSEQTVVLEDSVPYGSEDEQKAEGNKELTKEIALKKAGLARCAESLCESWRWSLLTTLLTFYALFGDDFRLAYTHKDMDNVFDVVTTISILVFLLDIFAASLGRPGYFKSFFFHSGRSLDGEFDS